MFKNFNETFIYKISCWCLIVFIFGFIVGAKCTLNFNERRLEESIKLGGVLLKDKVYELKERL